MTAWHGIESLLVSLALLWLLCAVSRQMTPQPLTVIRAVTRVVTNLLWHSPIRRLGLAWTLWGYLLLAAILLTALGSGWSVLWLWLLVLGGLLLARGRARRRYMPRPLPTRHHYDRRQQ